MEFENLEGHRPHVVSHLTLCAGEYLGDMAILGEPDWASSTCLCDHLKKMAVSHAGAAGGVDEEPTEICVRACPNEFVVVIELDAEAFQQTLDSGSAVTKAALQAFLQKWRLRQAGSRSFCRHPAQSVGALVHSFRDSEYSTRAVRGWEKLMLLLRKTFLHAADHDDVWLELARPNLLDPKLLGASVGKQRRHSVHSGRGGGLELRERKLSRERRRDMFWGGNHAGSFSAGKTFSLQAGRREHGRRGVAAETVTWEQQGSNGGGDTEDVAGGCSAEQLGLLVGKVEELVAEQRLARAEREVSLACISAYR